MEVTLKQAALVSVNDGTIIVKKNGKNYTYKNASVKSIVDGNITLEDYFWKPMVDYPYYYICASGKVCNTINDGTFADKDIISIGNCFRTEKEAEQYIDKFKEVFKR